MSLAEVFGVVENLLVDTEQHRAWHQQAVEAMNASIAHLDSAAEWGSKSAPWKLEAENKETEDKCYSRQIDSRKMFAIAGRLDIKAQTLFDDLWQHVERTQEWNGPTKELRRLEQIAEQTDVIYTKTHKMLTVDSRDTVTVRMWRKVGDSFVQSGVSIDYPPMPPQNGCVRAETYPGMIRLTPVSDAADSCELELLTGMDLKGWLPKALIDQFMGKELLEYIKNIRKHVETLKKSTATANLS
uniref:START domain-containing protein n=1 Tax=Plectus sambesii TaxID=2011161 RepID=A0A914VWQ2_9BILA